MNTVGKAVRAMGCSRQQFYEIRRSCRVYGAEGLVHSLPGCTGAHPNRLREEVEKAILDRCLENQPQGCLRVAYELSLKGVGRVYPQSGFDCYSHYTRDRLHTTEMPVTAVHTPNNSVLLFFEKHNTAITTVLSDKGRKFSGRPDQHLHELFSQLEGIEHCTTKVRRPLLLS